MNRAREISREWAKANPEKQISYQAKYRASHPEKSRYKPEVKARYREKNREKLRAQGREYRRARRGAHGLGPGEFEAMWEAQDGRCCYCERPLPRAGKVVIDHDHTCCSPLKSCSRCRRGLSHNNCNVIVGMANEDWDLLMAIAANGRPLQASVREQIEGKPVQGELLNVVELRKTAGD